MHPYTITCKTFDVTIEMSDYLKSVSLTYHYRPDFWGNRVILAHIPDDILTVVKLKFDAEIKRL